MDLKHIKGIGPSKQEKLKAAGIHSVDEMARSDVVELSQKTGITESSLREYKQKATGLSLIEDLKSVGPATVTVLAEAGVESLKDLYEASTDWLAKELKVAQAKAKQIQREAADAAKHVAEGAKTSEGRKQLLIEGRDLAQKTAKNAEKITREAIARAQKDGEMVMAKAQEFRAKAPEVVAKAKATAKDVEVKVKAVAHKAQETVKAEALKVKAANEQLVTRTRAKFHKSQV